MELAVYQNWQLSLDDDGVLWLGFDKQDARVNTLSQAVIEELSTIVTELEKGQLPKAIIVYSCKERGFIMGADVNEFTQITDSNQATSLCKKVQTIFSRFEALPVNKIAMIAGYCLGGGLELALCCNFRVIEDSRDTQLGLPEVRLGILPGWGGSTRLPRLLGVEAAMDMMLTGRHYYGKKALASGLCDACVPKRQLLRAAMHFAHQPYRADRHCLSWRSRLLNISMMRPLVAWQLRKRVAAQKISATHYPAPYTIIKNWLKFAAKGERALVAEANSVGQLLVTPTSRELLRVFFLQEKLKKLAQKNDFTLQHVHVIGAGTMGGDIASWCALQGLTVTLQDRAAEYISPAIKRAHKFYQKKLKEPRLISRVLDRLLPDVHGEGIKKADIIIEAIFENIDAKRLLFKELELQAKPEAILATNTSSIPLDDINTVLSSPERLVGIHFFNPVSKMQLVEVVKGQKTAPAVVQKALSFVRQINRLPLPVKSSPGFLINRILMPYLMECIHLVEEGIAYEVIDHAAETFGMPMGPIELLDRVGLDVCLSVANNLAQYYGGEIPATLKDKVDKQQLGVKTGDGFYHYQKGRAQKASFNIKHVDIEHIYHRLTMRMLQEAFACLREGVVSDGELLDAGLIFGTGFAPFRGGLINYAKKLGQDKVTTILTQLQQSQGDRFKCEIDWHQLPV